MNKRLIIIVAGFLLMSIQTFSTAWAGSWGKLVYDTELSSQTKENFQEAIDAVDKLFAKYKIVLSNKITMVVAGNDSESYIRALMVHGHVSRAVAEDKMRRVTLGQSVVELPIVIIRYYPIMQLTPQGTSYQVYNPEEGFFVLPHEVFHQVKNQYSRVRAVNWLQEGPADLFKFMALETAGIRRVTDSVQQYEQSIRLAAEIPDTRELASYDYETWTSLSQKKYPVYPMAAIMTYRLVGNNGFEKVIFFHQLLHNGSDPDKAFTTAFGMQMSDFLADMNDYFSKLRRPELAPNAHDAAKVRDYKLEYRAEKQMVKEIKRDGRFIAYDNDTVLDSQTNLMWAAKDNGYGINWQDAKKYCETYRGGGYTDWRMPTLNELAGLYDAAKTYSSECPGFFDGSHPDVHLTELIRLTCVAPWASETRGSVAAQFDFNGGGRYWFPPTTGPIYRALPVRSSKLEANNPLHGSATVSSPPIGAYKGVRSYENGDKYEGEFVDRKIHGKGIYTYANGDKYEGEFVDGKFTSKGTFTCSNGNQFTGNLENRVPLEFTIRCN